MHGGPRAKSMHLRYGWPSSGHACQLTLLIVMDMYIHIIRIDPLFGPLR